MTAPATYTAQTYLQLAQRLVQEASVNGTGPISVIGQTGELSRIAGWVQDAWREIQGTRLWNWQWERPTLTMLATTDTLATGIQAQRYLRDSFYVPVTGQMGRFCDYIPWDEFRQLYPFVQPGPNFNVWTVDPAGTIRVDVKPTANVDFTVERHKRPTKLALDADVPDMPAEFHDLIWMVALVRYANYDEAGVQRNTTIDLIGDMKADLYRDQLQQMRLGASLLDQF